MRVLITGGCGFIGSNLVEFLHHQRPEWHLVVFDALTYAGRLETIPASIRGSDRFFFVRGRLEEAEVVGDLVAQCQMIVNLAAESHVDNSILDASRFAETNALGPQVLFDAARRSPVRRIVHISSSEVYGTCQIDPMPEEHPLNPMSPYAATKAAGDRLAYAYWQTYRLPVVTLRPFNNYGARQHPEKLVPQIIVRLLRGQDYAIQGNGTAERDWLHVTDTCEAILKALEIHGIEGGVFNLGTGRATSVRQVSAMLKKLVKSRGRARFGPDRPGQVSRHRADARWAFACLHWESQMKLEEGLAKTVEWYREHPEWWERYCQ